MLVKNQTNGFENGIYYVHTAGNTGVNCVLKRTDDANTSSNLTPGCFVFAERGSTQDNIGFILTQNSTADFTSIDNTFGQFTGAASISAGNGVTVTGESINVNSTLNHVTQLGTLSELNVSGNVDITGHNGSTTGLKLNNTLVTSTAADLNILDGVTANTSEINKLAGLNTTTSELEKLSGMTSTKTELNYLTNSSPGTINTGGAVIYGNSGEVTANHLTFTSATMKGHIIPDSNEEYDIGTPERKIRDIYISTGSMWIGDGHKMGISNGGMTVRKRKTDLVPEPIIAAGGSGADALAFIGVSNIEDLTLNSWLAYGQTLDIAGKGVGNAEITDIFTDDASNYDNSFDFDGIQASSDEINVLKDALKSTVVNGKGAIYGDSGELNATTLQIAGQSITADASEINLLDGVSPGVSLGGKAVIYSNNGKITGELLTNAQPNITSVGTLNGLTIATSQNIDVNFNVIDNLADPTDAAHAATKSYVDSISQGLSVKLTSKAATTANLSATYDNGADGVGATLTSSATEALVIDDVTLVSGERVVVKNQTNGFENGIYSLTTVGDGSTAWVLTRATDCDDASKISSAFTFVSAGTQYENIGFTMNTSGTISVGTTNLVFTEFSAAGQVTAGTGLSKSGTTLSIEATQPTITQVGTLSSLTVSGDIEGAQSMMFKDIMVHRQDLD